MKKKKKKRRIIVSLCAGILTSCLLAGCGKGDSLHVPQIMSKPVLKVDGESYSLSEAKVYLVNYQNLYGGVFLAWAGEGECAGEAVGPPGGILPVHAAHGAGDEAAGE